MWAKNILKTFMWFTLMFLYSISFWSTTNFKVELSPNKAAVWEALDLTVTALDKDWNPDKTYVWEVLIFSQSDPKAEFPGVLAENIYKFKTSDQWVVKFENSVKFTKSWTQDINVFDVSNEDVFWVAEAEISTWWATQTTTTQSWSIKITTPENGTTIWTWSLKINWETLKNSKVVVTLNWNTKLEAISWDDWKFQVEAKNLPSWENSIKADVLDASWKVVSSSDNILLKVESMAPSLKWIKVSPEWKVEWDKPLNIEITADSGLTEVNVVLNDVIQKLTETATWWVYTWSINSPKENWNYKLDVVLKNELWVEFTQNWALEITVENIELNAAAELSCEDLQKDLVIKWVKVTKMKSKSVLSWDKLDKASSYNVYKKNKTTWGMDLVQNVTEPRIEINISGETVDHDDFAVKAVLNDLKCNNVESKDFSEMTKVQTWPKEMALVLLAILTSSAIFFFRRKRQSV